MMEKRTIIFEATLIVLALVLAAVLVRIPGKDVVGLAIKEDSLVNTGNVNVNVTEEHNGNVTGQIVLMPEEGKKINVTENKTYYGRKND